MPIDETAQTMFGMGRFNPMTLLQIFREINSILSMFRTKNSKLNAQAVGDTLGFTGQHTDIALVAEKGSLNAAEIEKIPDEQLRENVQRSFSEAVQDGYLNYDGKTRDFTLTQKGSEHINSEAFMEQFEKDRLEQMTADKAQIALKGNEADLNVFRFTDSISLNHLAHSDPAAFKRVQEYFYECEKYGFLHISSDGIVTPTEKCMKYLNEKPLRNFEIRKITPDNVREISKELKNSAGEAARNTFGSLVDTAEGAVGAVTKTVSFASGESSGADLASEGARFAAQQGTRKIRDTAAKKAAAKAGTKAAVKAGTTAAAGAASFGIGAAASAIIDLTTKGAKVLTNLNTQNHKPTITTRR